MSCKKFKQIIALLVVITVCVSNVGICYVNAESEERYPYVLYASNIGEAIKISCNSICVNGDIFTNGGYNVSATNSNINGTITFIEDEVASDKDSNRSKKDMIYIHDKLMSMYFLENVEYHDESYLDTEYNQNVNKAIYVKGTASLKGNVSLNSAIGALTDVDISGQVINCNNSIIYSKFGNISLSAENTSVNGLIYAPYGTVTINSNNFSMNGIVIADRIIINANCININYNSSIAELVGTTSVEPTFEMEEWRYLPDDDCDGIPNYVENQLGTDYLGEDTDGDGLSDVYELFNLNTSPVLKDTDEDGMDDCDEDIDEDGLNNLQEYNLGTYPSNADSDEDGLKDGDEVNVYGTDPTIPDSDSDNLEDGDEIYFKTNPLIVDTDGNGICDGAEKRLQSFNYAVEDSVITNICITMDGTANIMKTTDVQDIMDIDMMCSGVVGLVGSPYEITTTSEFNNATISFTIDKDLLGETDFNNLMFLWYDEENNCFVELETISDEENSTVSVNTSHFSKYMIVDQQAWFDNWKEIEATFGEYATNTSVTSICVDCSGSMSSNDAFFTDENGIYTCYRKLAIANFVNAMSDKDETSIILFNSLAEEVCGLTSDKEKLINSAGVYSSGGTNANSAIAIAVKELVYYEGEDVNKNIILLSDGDVNLTNTYLKLAVENSIRIHTVYLGESNGNATLESYANLTKGEYFIAASSSELEAIYNKLSFSGQLYMNGLVDSDMDTLPDEIEKTGIPMPNGEMVYTDSTNADTDGDKLADGMEVGSLVRQQPTFCYVPQISSIYKFYFDIKSNPTLSDSDRDKYTDYSELQLYKTDALHCDVTVYSITNTDYIQVAKDDVDSNYISYGGDQGWFSEEGKFKNIVLSDHGCGLVSCSDILLYMSMSDSQYMTNLISNNITYDENGYIDYTSYMEYLCDMNEIINVMDYLGTNGVQLMCVMNMYSNSAGFDWFTSWETSADGEIISSKIQEMLNNDIPVMLSMGPNLSSAHGVNLYDWVYSGAISPLDNPYRFEVGSYSKKVNGHFVTVTGLIVDEVKNQRYLRISSWGLEFYINFDEYLEYMTEESNRVFTNILYIYER